MTFAKRHLSFSFTLGQGAYATGADTVTVEGLRASVSITKSGGVSMSECSIRIYGMPLDVMNRLSILGAPLLSTAANTVTVSADGALCYSGTIKECWIDPNGAPAVSLVVTAVRGGFEKMKPVPPLSYPGDVAVEQVMADIAASMNVPLENSGVTGVTLNNVYLSGTAYDQAHYVANAADFNCLLDDTVLAIWKRDASRNIPVVDVSASLGMIGYPTRTQQGISVEMLYNPGIQFGGVISVTSLLDLRPQSEKVTTPVSSSPTQWAIYSVSHELETETHDGKWFTTVECSVFGQVLAVAS